MKRARTWLTGLLLAASFVACDKDPVGEVTPPPVVPPVTPPVPPPAKPEILLSGLAVPGMESYDSIISDLMRKHSIPGGAVAVMRDGKLIYARGFGYADAENKTPAQPDALFRIASVSKPITSAAIMKLVGEGKIELDEPVAPIISDLTSAQGEPVDSRWDAIKIRHLLNHTGGWDRGKPNGGFDPVDRPIVAAAQVGAPAPASPETLVRYMKGMPLDFYPGEKFAYSNFGYIILGRVIERVSGMSYKDYVRTHILEPVGANRTQQGRSRLAHALPGEVKYYWPGSNVNNPLAPSVFPGEGLVPFNYGGFHHEASDASGAWVSSTIDLLRFLGGVDGRPSRPDILSPALISQMTSTGPVVCANAACYYAFGWTVRPTQGQATWSHGGTLPGTTAMLVRTYHNFSMVGLFNTRSLSANLEAELYSALWNALDGATSFPTHDLFRRSNNMTKRFLWPFMAVIGAGCAGDSSAPKGPTATKIAVVSGTPQSAQAGQPLPAPLVVLVTDAGNQPVPNALVSFTINSGGGTLSQAIDTTDASGHATVIWTVGTSPGSGQVQARAQFVTAPAGFAVTIAAGPPALITQSSNAVGATASGFETADSIAIKITDSYNNPIAGQAVAFSVISGAGAVSAANRNTGVDGVARTAWTVGNAGAQTLRATAGPLHVDVNANAVSCGELTLAVGEVQSLDPANAACTILKGSAQRYLVTIVNPTNSTVSAVAFTGRGASGTTSAQVVEPVATAPAVMPAVTDRDRTHALILERNMQLLQRFGPQEHAALRNPNPVAPQNMPPAVGDLVPIKLPDITGNGCVSFIPVVGRVVYAGAKAIMLEDTTNALKGQVDTVYTRLGQEFDNVMFPILSANFGDPLAMDAQLNNDGAMYMLFSTKVNTIGNGMIAGFVNNADFLTTAQCPSSNRAEVFYARAPTSLGSGPNEPAANYDWARTIASTIIHEAKHLTSFATKRVQPGFTGLKAGDAWLEESSAEISQELLSRVTFAYTAESNVGHAATIAKEVRPSSGMPMNMFNAFSWLYKYFQDPESLSLVGSVAPGDVTFYGSGWAFLRWVIDTYATTEQNFLTAMTREVTHGGVANIENITGKSFQQLLSEFSLALALDDYPDFTATDTKYSFPSWNLRSVFAGMNADFPNAFPSATPLKVRANGFGKFTVGVSGVRGGGFSVLQLSGTQANRQLLEFKGTNGTAFPAEMRVNIVRVQ